jgi:hypothetical protein
MAHLKKLPTYFVKDGVRKSAYYTIQARELRKQGFVEEGEKAVKKDPISALPEIVVEAGATAYDSTDSLQEPQSDGETLEQMTKAELLDWALEKGFDLKNNDPKSEIFQRCKEIEAL